jgi:hypothetical protein
MDDAIHRYWNHKVDGQFATRSMKSKFNRRENARRASDHACRGRRMMIFSNQSIGSNENFEPHAEGFCQEAQLDGGFDFQ